MHERLKRIIFKKLDQDLGQAEIIVDDNKSIWFIDRANKFWYLELRSSGSLWWRYTFFNDFFLLFGMVREEYEPVISEWVEEVLKRGVSSTAKVNAMKIPKVEEVLKRGVSSTCPGTGTWFWPVEEVLKRGVSSTLRRLGSGHGQVEDVLKRGVSSTEFEKTRDYLEVEEVLKRGVSSTHPILNSLLLMVEEVLKRGVSSTGNYDLELYFLVEEVLKRGVSSTEFEKTRDYLEVEEVLKREVYSTQCNVGLQGSRPVEEVLESKASPTTVDNLSAVVTMKKVLSLKAGVRECKMKIKKIFKKIIT